jgi:hypothetical protein
MCISGVTSNSVGRRLCYEGHEFFDLPKRKTPAQNSLRMTEAFEYGDALKSLEELLNEPFWKCCLREEAAKAIEQAPLRRNARQDVYWGFVEKWAENLRLWTALAFSEYFDFAKAFEEPKPDEWAEQKVREFIKPRLGRSFSPYVQCPDEDDGYGDRTYRQLKPEECPIALNVTVWVAYVTTGDVLVEPRGTPFLNDRLNGFWEPREWRGPAWMGPTHPILLDGTPEEQTEFLMGRLDASASFEQFVRVHLCLWNVIESALTEARHRAFLDAVKSGYAPSTKESLKGPEYLFRQDGDLWEIRFKGALVRVPNLRGIQYIAYLLQNADKDIHVDALNSLSRTPLTAVAAVVPVTLDRTSHAAAQAALRHAEATKTGFQEHGLSIQLGLGAEDAVPDEIAQQQYKKRARELLAEMANTADEELRAKFQEELEAIEDQLQPLTRKGWKRKSKKGGSNRARLAVKRAIDTAYEALRSRCAELQEHLQSRIQTGTYCCYRSDRNVQWFF